MVRLILVFTFYLVGSGVLPEECHHRDYHHGSTVCVCSEAHCDSLGPSPARTQPGVVTTFESSKVGHRLHKQTKHFTTDRKSATIRIDIVPGKRFQRIIGFGGAFTDAAGLNIAKLPTKLQDHLIEDYFGPNGLEYNMGRVPIGGSDFSTRAYSYDDDHPGDFNLTHFRLQPEDVHYKIPYMHRAIKASRKQIKFFGSPWSSPAWMKTNNEIQHGGFLKGQPGGKYYKLWAEYIVKFLDSYAKNNLSMWGLTVENEPSMGFRPTYPFNSLGFNATMERDFIKLDLGPALEKAGWGRDRLKLMIMDDNIWLSKNYSQTILSDLDASKFVAGVAFHWYSNKNRPQRAELDFIHEKFSNFFLLSTEACEMWVNTTQHVHLGEWALFRSYADDILKDLVHNSAGWIDWNLALDTEGGPNWVDNFVDAAIIVNASAKEYYRQPSYYALAHFSKFLHEGTHRVGNKVTTEDRASNLITSDGAAPKSPQVATFVRPDGATVLIVLNNEKSTSFEIEVRHPHKVGQSVHVHLRPDSMQTLVWFD